MSAQPPPDARLPLPRWAHTAWDAVLGSHPRVRRRVPTLLGCMAIYSVSCTLAVLATQLGLMREPFAAVFVPFTIVQLAVFYGLLRSGWSLRLRDPGMMFVQNLLALAGIAGAYASLAPAHRPAVLLVVGVVVVFGLYALTPRQALAQGACTALFLGPVMLVLPQFDPEWFDPRTERLRFELLAGTLPALSLSAHLIMQWRDKVVRQKHELQRTLERMQELVVRDGLTGAFNRRHMQERLEAAVNSGSFTLALIDLDHFKRINDTYGHRVGDQALRSFTQAAAGVLGEGDVLARWGGEEFLVLYRQDSPTQAQQSLDRLRAALQALPLSAEQPDLRVAFSAGVARHRPGESLDRLLERVDRALYAAKSAGRDRALLARVSTTMDLPHDVSALP